MKVELDQKSKEKGKARIQELQEAFPHIPRNIILKIDFLRHGVKHTVDLDYVGKWASPDGLIPYDLGKDGYHAKESAIAENLWIEKPMGLRFRDGTSAWVIYSKDSPYEVRYQGYGIYILLRDEEPIEEVFFIPRPEWYSKRSKIDGRPLCQSLTQGGDSALLLHSPTYCAYFATGDVCYFCPLPVNQQYILQEGHGSTLTVSVERMVEAFEVAYQEVKERNSWRFEKKAPCSTPGCLCINLHMTGGGMYNRHKEAKRYERYILGLKKAMGDLPDVNIGAEIQALDPEDSKMLADAGLHVVHYNLECWDKRMFSITCPGKSKYVGWERWVDNLVAATEYFQRGHVHSVFVGGLEMVPPEGFKREEEALQSFFEGMEWLGRHGVSTLWTVFMPSPDATVAQKNAVPSTEYYLNLGWECHQIHLKYNLYGPTRGAAASCRCCSYDTPGVEFSWLR